MIKETLGTGAFYSRGAPQFFMTDNCDAERKALSATWPAARCFLCIFHIHQQVWKWLVDASHSIKKEDRQGLMGVMKALIYAKSNKEFFKVWEDFQANPLATTYSDFTR